MSFLLLNLILTLFNQSSIIYKRIVFCIILVLFLMENYKLIIIFIFTNLRLSWTIRCNFFNIEKWIWYLIWMTLIKFRLQKFKFWVLIKMVLSVSDKLLFETLISEKLPSVCESILWSSCYFILFSFLFYAHFFVRVNFTAFVFKS